MPGVILLGGLIAAPLAPSQVARKTKVDEGPRAVALLQLGENGKGRLFPVAIMVDGKFYDAAAYKAMPVPMALDFDIVYEGFRTGISQGLFTIKQPGHLGRAWIAEGTWLPAGAKVPDTHLKAEAPVIEEKDEPPKLHRGDKAADTDKTAAKAPEKPADTASTTAAKPAEKAGEQKPSTSPTATPPASAPSSSPEESAAKPTIAEDRAPEDPNRPRLRRGKPDPATRREAMKDFDEVEDASAKPGVKKAAGAGGIDLAKLMPAISDAGGPDPRSYKYDLKPDEEADFRARMLDLAGAELRAQAIGSPANAKPVPHTNRKPPAAKIAFDDVQMRTFDLSNTNQPVLVLSARTHAPLSSDPKALPQEITLVARTNLEGELHKLFFSATDAHNLDITPRMELIDAVDADGDGRGELLFRRNFDNGNAYGIYRATADQLWPLFEGTP